MRIFITTTTTVKNRQRSESEITVNSTKNRVFSNQKIELNQTTTEQPDVDGRETGVSRVLCKGQQTMRGWGWGGVHGTTSNGEYAVFFPLIALD